jgi:predicted dienelactone hydrolase
MSSTVASTRHEEDVHVRPNVGCRTVEVLDPIQGVRIPTSLFFPTHEPPRPERFEPFVLDVATNAAVAGEELPLVLISHGTGSSPWLFRQLGAHLAREGFVVAMIRHPGNNRGDDGLAFTVVNLENRPRHLQLVIEAAFADELVGPRLARGSVGVIGHSIGAYTALAIAGGRPMAGANETKDGIQHPVDVVHDARVAALVLLAPAAGWYMNEGALAGVNVPILLRSGDRDEFTQAIHGDIIERGVRGRVDRRVVVNAGHFSFFSPYPEELKRPELAPSQDPPGFDRRSYQATLHEEIATFLRATLS